MIASFGIGQKTSEDGLPLLFFQAVPINPGYLFQQVSDVAIALDPEPDVRLLILGDIELFDLAVDAAREDQGRVLLAALTLAARTATDLLTEVGGGPKELLPRDHGLELGPALPFGSGHPGRAHGDSFVLLYVLDNS
jgi:hypothetical protein